MKTASLSANSLVPMAPDSECKMPIKILSSFDPDAGRVNSRLIRSDADLLRSRRIGKDVFISCRDELKNHGLPCHSLGKDRIDNSKLEAMRDSRVDFLTDEDGGAESLVHTFDA
jgi:hypothetical protein